MLCSLVPYKGGIPCPKVRVFPDCPLRNRILLAQVGRGSLESLRLVLGCAKQHSNAEIEAV